MLVDQCIGDEVAPGYADGFPSHESVLPDHLTDLVGETEEGAAVLIVRVLPQQLSFSPWQRLTIFGRRWS